MVLGTCNFNWEYNGSFVSKEDAFKLLDYFYAHGGRIIDTAYNYHGNGIIKEWLKNNPGNELKIMTKVWNESECWYIDYVYCVFSRKSNNDELINALKILKNNGDINKYGISIYYPNELRQDVNAFHIPASTLFIDYLDTMLLHADVFVRSLYNLHGKIINNALSMFECFKIHERPDLNHHVYPVIGVSNLKQLKENMELFK